METNDTAEHVRSMFQAFVSVDDICLSLDMGERELDEFCRAKFALSLEDAARKFAAQGRAKVHQAQVAAALEGDRSMLLLLGKQYLGQSDEPKAPPTIDEKETPLDRARSKRADAADRKSKAAR